MLSQLPKKVRIVEVGPRDGLQNEKTIIATSDKLRYIKLLSEAGIRDIEATSFVRSEKIPQMTDGKELFTQLTSEKSLSGNRLMALVPNEKGLEVAIAAGVKEIAVFTSNSNTFNQRNINATVDESLVRIEKIASIANAHNIKMRGYISTVFGCPYEGKTSLELTTKIAHFLFQQGVYEVSLGDTIGVANPLQVKDILNSLKSEFDFNKLAMHFHDTRALAVSNVLTSLEMGITNFDASSAGLGGCPYAKGASGNVATEDLVYLFESMNIQTGISMEKLANASEFILSKLNKTSSSKALTAFLASRI